MTNYAIENENGQWWTGECWGCEQAKEMFGDLRDLPRELPEDNNKGTEFGHVYDYDTDAETLDVRYCLDNSFARVRVV